MHGQLSGNKQHGVINVHQMGQVRVRQADNTAEELHYWYVMELC